MDLVLVRRFGLFACFIGSAIIVIGASSGCSRWHEGNASNPATDLDRLRTWVENDRLLAPEGSAYPEPGVIPQNLLRYARENYDEEGEVRGLVCFYFLRYDSALLDRGLITASAGPDTLVGLLWEKEASGWVETPSAFMMREQIWKSKERLCLGRESLDLLERNRNKKKSLVAWWKSHAEDE